jgi:hypothetical protein
MGSDNDYPEEAPAHVVTVGDFWIDRAPVMRAWTEKIYGPPEQVVGSIGGLKFEMRRHGSPALINLPHIDFIDDGPGKPVGIERFIGRRPIFAFGNSDGDLQMLQWTAAGSGARLWDWSITPTPNANTPTTAIRTSAGSKRHSMRARQRDGRLST